MLTLQLLTHTGSFHSVDMLQVTWVTETLFAMFALERFLFGLDMLCRHLNETLITWEGFFPVQVIRCFFTSPGCVEVLARSWFVRVPLFLAGETAGDWLTGR